MKVTRGSNFNRTESIGPPQCGGGRKKAPAYGGLCLPISLGRQLFAYRGGAVADLLNRLLEFFLRYLQMLGPILDLLGFVHVDLRAIVLALAFQALHFVLLMKSKSGVVVSKAFRFQGASAHGEQTRLCEFCSCAPFCARPMIAWRSESSSGRRNRTLMATTGDVLGRLKRFAAKIIFC
jgi:hypothetical protein